MSICAHIPKCVIKVCRTIRKIKSCTRQELVSVKVSFGMLEQMLEDEALSSPQCCSSSQELLFLARTHRLVWKYSICQAKHLMFALCDLSSGIQEQISKVLPALLQTHTGEEEEQRSLWCSIPGPSPGWGLGSVPGSTCNAGTS